MPKFVEWGRRRLARAPSKNMCLCRRALGSKMRQQMLADGIPAALSGPRIDAGNYSDRGVNLNNSPGRSERSDWAQGDAPFGHAGPKWC